MMKTHLFRLTRFMLCLGMASLMFAQEAELNKAKEHFYNGEFDQAIDLLEEKLATNTLPNKAYQQAAEYLAVSYITKNQEDHAKAVFAKLLEQDASYKPNDYWWPHKKLMATYYSTVKEQGLSLGVPEKGPGIKTIAIIDFENNAIEDAEKYENLGRALSKILINDFFALSKLQVVERERLQYLLDELKLTDEKVGGKNIMDPSSAPRVGKLLGAHSFVFGSFIRLGDVFRLDARLVKTETGEIFKTASVEGEPDEIFELAKELTVEITQNLDVEIEKLDKEKLEKVGEQGVPIDALALFGDAMSDANQEDYNEAVLKLEEALALAPDFNRAQDMLDTLRPLTLYAAN